MAVPAIRRLIDAEEAALVHAPRVIVHVAAILRAGAIDASAPPGTYSVTPVEKVIKSMTPAQIHAAEGLAATACRGAPSFSVLSATVNAAGTGKIKTPDVFFDR